MPSVLSRGDTVAAPELLARESGPKGSNGPIYFIPLADLESFVLDRTFTTIKASDLDGLRAI